MKKTIKLVDFDNSYARLPGDFYRHCLPVQVRAPRLIAWNQALADELGLQVQEADLTEIFTGNRLPEGAEPIALAYAGHQFGHFVPQLGDGRAILLGEVWDRTGIRRDIQLKGSGQTPFSRNGDGRAALGPVIREYIVSEAMHALGIRTTRSLAAVMTGEQVQRETLLPGAVLTRVAASHVRIGTFEYFAARSDRKAVQTLADYVIDRHYGQAKETTNPYRALFEMITDAQARLIASWMHVGFIHGVMNTDNMAISGETIDYGPCAFMDHYDPMMVFSSIDRNGRYAFGNQPTVAQWNLARFAETLLPLLDADTNTAIGFAEQSLDKFKMRFQQYWLDRMRGKLGLTTQDAGDEAIVQELLTIMHRNEADYTLVFRLLSKAPAEESVMDTLKSLFKNQSEFNAWVQRWQSRLEYQPQSLQESAQYMQRTNPAYIPRNHRIAEAIRAAVDNDDFIPMNRLHDALANPYVEQEATAVYALPPLSSERVRQTFCGT